VPGVLSLSLDDAVKRALRSNLGLIDNQQMTAEAHAARIKALSALLPHLEGAASQNFQTMNWDTIGAQKIGLGNNIGPYSWESATLSLDQQVLNLSALHGAHAAEEGAKVSLSSQMDSRNIVVLAAVSAYLQAATAASHVEVAKAELASATTFFHLMEDRVHREVSPDIDLIRAKVAMQTAEQALALREVGLEKSKLSLARVIGLHVAQQFSLTDAIHYQAKDTTTLDTLVQQAVARRQDLQAAEQRVKEAEEAVNAASAERLPSLGIHAYYGGYGINPGTFYGNYTVSGTIKVPVFTGRAIQSDIDAAKARLVKARAEYQDLRERTEFDVRTSYLDFMAADKSVQVADGNRQLARDGMRQSEDRFNAGVAQSLEVIQAQSVVAQAEDNYISSMFAQDLAKLMLARATGTAEENVHRYLGEQ
jgi:outer membrane protein TolC